MAHMKGSLARRDAVSLPLNDGTVEKLEVAKSMNNIRMALEIIQADFASVSPPVTIDSNVHEAFEEREANALFKAGYKTVRDVANSTEGVLLCLPNVSSKTVAIITARVKEIVE